MYEVPPRCIMIKIKCGFFTRIMQCIITYWVRRLSPVDNCDYVKYTNSGRYIKHSESLCHEYFLEDKMMGIRGKL